MPFVSRQQQRWAHTKAGTKALGGPAKVHEWDVASKGKDLPMYSKGTGLRPATYAEGGPVITTVSRFLKTPNEFTTGKGVPQDYGKSGKGGELSKMEGDSKSEPPVKPRS